MSSKLITTCAECTTNCISEHPPNSRHSYRTYELNKFKERVYTFYSSDQELWHDEIDPLKKKLEELVMELFTIKEDFEQECENRRLEHAFQSQKGKNQELIDAAKAAVKEDYAKLSCKDVAKIQNKIELHRKVSPKEISKICHQLVENAQGKLTKLFNKLFQLKKGSSSGKTTEREAPKYEKERQKAPSARQSERTPTERSYYSDEQEEQRKNDLPTVKIRQISQISTHFNVTLKVISVDKEFYLDGERKVQFQAGDETGTATVVTKALKLIEEGTVITISNARVYKFHGSKQIQMDRSNSYIIQQKRKSLTVSDDYNLSGKPRRGGNRNRERRENREKNDRIVEDRQQREERPIQRNRYQEQPQVRQRDRQMQRQREREQKEREQLRQKQIQEQQRQLQQRQKQEKKRQEQARLRAKERDINQSSRNIRKAPDQPTPQRDLAKYQQTQKTLPNLKKIKDIEPGEDNLSFIAQIIELKLRQKTQESGNMFCVLGDETAIVDAQLPRYSGDVKKNTVLLLSKVQSRVINGHLRIFLENKSSITRTNMRIPPVNTKRNISADQYEEQEEEEEEEEIEEKQDNDDDDDDSDQDGEHMAVVEDF